MLLRTVLGCTGFGTVVMGSGGVGVGGEVLDGRVRDTGGTTGTK